MSGGSVGAVGAGAAAVASSASVSSAASAEASSQSSSSSSSAKASNATKVTLSENAKAAAAAEKSVVANSELRGMTLADDPAKNIKMDVVMPKRNDESQVQGVSQAMAAYSAAASIM